MDKIGKLIISREATVKEALRQLDSGAERVLFTVDGKGRLTGLVVDGDIRRHILKDGSLQDRIDGCVNNNPYSIHEGYDADAVKALMVGHRVEVVPILDKDSVLVDFVTWGELFGGGGVAREDIGLPVVIMAGGKGTRLSPFTKILPKPLIPIGDTPVVQVIMEKFHAFGVHDFYLTINYKGEMIKSYFDNTKTEFRLHYVWEKEFLGTAGGLRLLPQDMPGTFIVSNCDIIVEADYADLVAFHRKNGNRLTVVGSIQHYKIPYGIIEYGEDGRMHRVVEKPEYDLTVNTGVYVLEKGILEYMPEGKQFDMTDLIDALLTAGEKVGVYPVSEKSYLDIGQWEGYRNSLDRLIVE